MKHTYQPALGREDRCEVCGEPESVCQQETVDVVVTPVENVYADFFMREGASLGALHAALNALKTVDDLQTITGDETEELNAARDIINRVHGYVLTRCEYRRLQMHRIKKNLEEDGHVG